MGPRDYTHGPAGCSDDKERAEADFDRALRTRGGYHRNTASCCPETESATSGRSGRSIRTRANLPASSA